MVFFFIWIAFICYAVWVAPDGNEGYLQQLVTMDDPDPLLLMVFSLLGVYPMAFALILLGEDDSALPVWPFVIGSFGLGAFALMPYFFLSRGDRKRNVRTPKSVQNLIQSTLFKALLFAGAIALFVYGFSQGDASLYARAFQSSQFVHVMTVDFFVLTALSVFVIFWKEGKRERVNQRHWMGIIPVIGLLAYLLLRKEEEI
ncbi:hypothetical protein LCM20_10940 [Halobacillus litoralis]|uniref:hypothetical protein n=1 Tax=Halobacillus litoralis TaxID=45668 RepID=UPI001CD22291|nr:hypothetical protein [Halobacillus litoralis]MCA0971108.1 hypothetical protein [Halobacillus litoralis]